VSSEHLERLTALDAWFLHQESSTAHMHVGALTIFEGPPMAPEELMDHLRGRLHLVPRYRQKLSMPPLGTGRPLWVDDQAFDLEDHVYTAELPPPGDEGQLEHFAARIFSRQLDRMRPLWEMWQVTGLADGRFALVFKTHHAMIDGIAGVDIGQVVLDLTPDLPQTPHPEEAWTAQPEPSPVGLLAAGAIGAARAGVSLALRAASAFLTPQRALNTASTNVEGLAEVVRAGLDPAPDSPLNVPITKSRRYATLSTSLADMKTIKNAFGGTVNDVILAAVSGSLRNWLHTRRVPTENLNLRALVPVSIRTTGERGQPGNRIAVMRGPLPVRIADPIERLAVVRAAMDGLKESKQAVGAEVLTSVQNFAPPTVLAQASRLNFSTRLFNLIVTNVPGPQFPLYVRGRRMVRAFPIAFLPKNHALAIAIMSYDGQVNFGLLADQDALPDVEVIAHGVRDEIAQLLALAGEGSSTNGAGAVLN
jgi:WS/DGAT/MGAT family acyltransferase